MWIIDVDICSESGPKIADSVAPLRGKSRELGQEEDAIWRHGWLSRKTSGCQGATCVLTSDKVFLADSWSPVVVILYGSEDTGLIYHREST